MIKKVKKTSDLEEANRLINEGWAVICININEVLLALHDNI